MICLKAKRYDRAMELGLEERIKAVEKQAGEARPRAAK